MAARGLCVALVLCASAARADAQLSAFAWQLAGNPTGSGAQTPTTLHVVGPDGYTCTPQLTWFETVLPVGGTVSVLLDFQNLDGWYYKGQAWYDGPAWVLDGLWETPPQTGSYPPGPAGWPTGPYQFDFEAEAGQRVGLGVWSQDCFEGPGIADFHDLVFTPKPWSTHAAALDPRALWTVPAGSDDPRLVVAGDVDLDGVADLVLTGPFSAPAGGLRFVSAVDGSPLLTIAPLYEGFESVGSLGDVDGDGRPDVAAGNSKTVVAGNAFAGSVRVFSSADGAVLLTVLGTAKWDELGERVAGIGDADLDGVPDIAVRLAKPFSNKSEVRVLSGATGATLETLLPTLQTHNFGLALAGLGDVTGDGAADVFVGTPNVDVRLYSGATGGLAKTLVQPDVAGFGAVLAPAGDVDGGGSPDLLVGAPGDNLGVGAVVVVSTELGARLTVVHGDPGGGEFGSSVAGGLDTNGDGRLDFVAGAPSSGPGGEVRVHDALDGTLLVDLKDSHKQAQLGRAVVLPPDVDGDGLGDIVALARPYDSPLPTQLRAWGHLDHPGPPQLAATGAPLANELVTITIANALPGAAGFIVVGDALVDLPLAGGVLAPQPGLLVPVHADAAGMATVSARWPAGLPTWTTLWMQAWMHDAAGPAGFTASDALAASQL